MNVCKELFEKLVKLLDNLNTFEDYYNFLKMHNPDSVFCEYCIDNEHKEFYTYKNFFNKVDCLTAYFEKELSTVSEQSWIGIKLANHPFYLATCFALLKNNFNVIFIDNKGSNDYFENIIKNSGMKAVITSTPFESDSIVFLDFNKALSSKSTLKVQNKTFANKLAFCTSGTTGYFKIVTYRGFQVISQIKSLFSLIKDSPITDMVIDKETKFLVFPPLHHIFGSIMFLTYTTIGTTNVICEKETITAFMNSIKHVGIQVAASVPLVWEVLIKIMKGKFKAVNSKIFRELLGEKLRFCICGGAHTPHEVIKLLNEAGIAFSECYGMTEAGMVTLNMSQIEKERMDGSIGNVNNSTCKIKILKPDGKITKSGIGELIIDGGGLYDATLVNKTEIPRENESLEGFIKTGDLVEIVDGNIYFCDRIKDVIINSTGENICPGELEKNFEFLYDMDAQFTVLGIDDFPVIVLVLSSEKNTEEYKTTLKEKIINANKNLPLNKKIVSIYFTTNPLPLTTALKVKKSNLKDLIKNDFANYQKVDLIYKNKANFKIEEIKQDLKTFFSEHLNLDTKGIKDDSLIIEELDVNSIIIAEIFIYIEEKYKIKANEDFILKDSLSVNDIANMIFQELQKL